MHRTIIALLTGSLSTLSLAAVPTPQTLSPTPISPTTANSCYIACYGHQQANALTSVGKDIYLMGRILVQGKYVANKCVPDGYENKDISQAPYFKELCTKQFPSCANQCWAGGDTNPASVNPYRPMNAQMNPFTSTSNDFIVPGNKKMSVSIPSISVEFTGRPNIKADGVIFNNTWDITSPVVNHITATSDISHLTIGDLSIGPIHLDGNVTNINLKALGMLIVMMNQASPGDNQSDAQIQLANKVLTQVITPSTTIQKNVLITTPEGNLTLNTDIHWNAQKPAPTSVPEILHSADISIAFKIAIPLVTKILTSIQSSMQSSGVTLSLPSNSPGTPISPFDAMINAGIQNGYILKDANNYQINITQKNGVLKINDTVLNLPYNPGPSLPPPDTRTPGIVTPASTTPPSIDKNITIQP